MARDPTGLKIRTLRRRAGMTQGALAQRAGISASYLNLIEGNKRAVGSGLLDRIAAGLAVDRATLDGEAERRIIDELEEISADAKLAAGLSELGPAADLVGRHPGWADLLLKVYRAYRDRNQAVLALADRLNRDPFLSESVHRMLTNVTSIRSAAEIVEIGEELAPADRDRFLAIIASDSAQLSRTAQALVDFFDSANTRIRAATPTERVDAFLYEAQNHFPELEEFAKEVAGHDKTLSEPARGALAESAETRRFAAIRDLAATAAADRMAAIVRRHPALDDEEARRLATTALCSYAAGAVLMPYEPFLEAAERHRYDPDMLARRFGVSYEQAAHRLVTLRRPGAEGVRFAFMRSDPSGYITKRLPLPRLPLPRYGNACPLWPVYGAFQFPGTTARSFGELPSGDRFLFFAKAVEKEPARAGFPRRLLSIMLACEAGAAHRVAAGDGIDMAAALVPVGTICRLCPRRNCAHRQEPALVSRAQGGRTVA